MIDRAGINSRHVGLCLVLIAGLAGCGGSDGPTTKDGGTGGGTAGRGGSGTAGAAAGGAGTAGALGSSGGAVGTGGEVGVGGSAGSGTGIGGNAGAAATGGAGNVGGAGATGGTAGRAAGGASVIGGAGGGGRGGSAGAPVAGAGGSAGGVAGAGGGQGGAGGAPTTCQTAATCPGPVGGNGIAACTNNMCQITCNTGYHRCGSVCDLNTSINSCGNSCTACPMPTVGGSATCTGPGGNLACGLICTTGYHQCGNGGNATCVINTSTSVTSCGTSCVPCVAPANGTVSCNGTACVYACNAGFHVCGATCVANNSTNVNSCGNMCATCTDPPNGAPTCAAPNGGAAPVCGITCDQNFHACPTANPTTCLANNNVNSCGANCAPCPARANAMASCQGGVCTYTCMGPRHMCGDVCVQNDANATCGTVDGACTPCGAGLTCSSTGVCVVSPCDAGTHRCGSMTTGTCLPNADIAHCGNGDGTCVACPAVPVDPNAHPVCAGGACATDCNVAFCKKTPTGTCLSNVLATSCGPNCTTCPGPTGTTPNGVASCNTTAAGGAACAITCDGGFHLCGTACFSNTDPAHCGSPACMTCPATQLCTNGACVPAAN